tara:strand:- start:169 stop:738 length:570 start_codon:yes stop_codon:yes gene_type:complete
MKKEDQINIINSTINKARENLRPLSFNLIFWGVMINLMSAFHYFFEPIVEYSKYSVILYWTIIPIFGMFYIISWNIKIGMKRGYETVLDRTIKIIWAVFGLGWMITLISSLLIGKSPVPQILFLLGLVLVMNGLIIKFKPLTIGGIFLFIFVFFNETNPSINYLIVNMIGVTLGMLIPGLFLYKMKNSG